MNCLPRIKEGDDNKKASPSSPDKKSKNTFYDYFNARINKSTIESILKLEKDDRFIYFLKYGVLRRYEGEGDILFVEIPQIPKKIVIYRRPYFRQKAYDRLYLNNMDMPHVPLFEGEENLKLLSLENNLINKIDHLVSLNNLLYLNLYANKIYEIENLQTVSKLRALMLGRNQIEKIKNLNNLVELEVLDLHSNKIKIIENLSSLKKLRLLNLANNQITSFSELLSNKNLEEINLRKNLIVTIPNSLNIMEKLKKLNVGKNVISRIENLYEIKKIKNLTELIIEDNPVLVLKDSIEIIKTLPVKSKSLILKPKDNKLVISYDRKFSNDMQLPEISPEQPEMKQKPQINTATKTEMNAEEISEDQSNNIISHIEKEWAIEFLYIKENGYNGYNTKRLRESKMVSGHAELEGSSRLNIFGNALEVLDQEEFYETISFIHFEYFNIDLLTTKITLDKLKKFLNFKKIKLSHCNVHSFYQLIKFEEFSDIDSVYITNNEICNSSFLKYFLIYRFQNLKFFNDEEINQKDVANAKKMFEYFDKCISANELKIKDKSQDIKKDGFTLAFDEEEKKQEMFNYVQDNLIDVLEEILDEYVI